VELQVVRTDLVQEVHQIFNEWISQVIRVYAGQEHVELEWLVGPIPIDDGTGKEIISRFESDIASSGVFWTDSNGREMLRRVRNKRETWDLDLQESIAGNYYPVTTKITIEDDSSRLSLLIDRAQGGSSLSDGHLELMVHRRLLRDDRFGVGEALNETQFGGGLIARGKHWLIFGPSSKVGAQGQTQAAKERVLQRRVHLAPWVFNAKSNGVSFEDFSGQTRRNFASVKDVLPLSVHLLTLEPWTDDEVLVRFEHIFETNEDPSYSQPVEFDIQDWFEHYQITDIKETTLAGNQLKSASQRLVYGPKKSVAKDPFKT
ncbi:lysosomal alpha-mannosidase-like, partial [Anopheles bellator]|uniref:lysosomal alpha-mannosidase-like n=1 Tax=Anopheles bellator TaxID=139047 RepID=UPI0026471424